METKIRKKRGYNEDFLQMQCVKWFKYQYPNVLIFAIPNGGYRNAIEAAKMKRTGTLAGVADLQILTPRGGYSGMFVEMKIGAGKQTVNQKVFQEAAEAEGYKYALCYSFDEFRENVDIYMKSKYSLMLTHIQK